MAYIDALAGIFIASYSCMKKKYAIGSLVFAALALTCFLGHARIVYALSCYFPYEELTLKLVSHTVDGSPIADEDIDTEPALISANFSALVFSPADGQTASFPVQRSETPSEL